MLVGETIARPGLCFYCNFFVRTKEISQDILFHLEARNICQGKDCVVRKVFGFCGPSVLFFMVVS